MEMLCSEVLTQVRPALIPCPDSGSRLLGRPLGIIAQVRLVPFLCSNFWTTTSFSSSCALKSRHWERSSRHSAVVHAKGAQICRCQFVNRIHTFEIVTNRTTSGAAATGTCHRSARTRRMLGRSSALHSCSKSSIQQDSGVDSGGGQQEKMPPLPEKHVVVGCGGVGIDYLASVAKYPNPDEKIRTDDFSSQGGGNAGNALTAAARLGLKPHILSKVANDSTGKLILEELERDGVNTKHVVVSEGGVTPFTYIIVDKETKTRTCIHTPGSPAMRPEELSDEAIASLLADASIVYFDVRLWETAIKLAKEAKLRGLPILVDAEKRREGLDELLSSATYIVAASKFPQHWTGETALPDALLQMMIKLPEVQFVIVTLGADGCVMLRRELDNNSNAGAIVPGTPELDIGKTLDELTNVAQKRRVEQSSQQVPVVVSSKVGWLMPSSPHSSETPAERTGVFGSLIYGTAVTMTPEEIVDTTGAGDAFIGAVLYALCAGMSPSSTLTLAATVASAKCRAMGARAGLPYREDSRVVNLLH